MKVLIYIESLRTFTSGMPHRGLLKELISLRSKDEFILVLRNGALPLHMKELLDSLKSFSNWKLIYAKQSRKLVNFLALFQYRNHASLNIKADIYLSFDAECLGTKNHPQVITLHDLSSVRNSGTSSLSYIKRLARKFIIENGVKNADHIVSISDFTKNDILDYFQIDSDKIITILNGIDSKWFEKNLEKNKVSESNYWIWWGAYSKRKNLINLLKAYELMLNENIQEIDKLPMLYLIGNKNEYFEQLELIVKSSVLLQSKIIFFPQKEFVELKKLVAESKGLLFPSLYEGFGLPVIEAYSQGKAVLTSNVSSLPEISGNLGVLVNPRDTIEIKNGLLKMYKEYSDDLKERKIYAEKFSYKNAALHYSRLIDKC